MERTTEIEGRRYGKLVVIEYGHRGKYRTYYKCRCDCGNECEVARQNLTSGKTRSCGCLRGSSPSRRHGKGGKKRELNESQIKWLTQHYMHTKNVELAEKLDISESTLHRYARRLGLQKSRQFMSKCMKDTCDAAAESHRLNGTYPPKGYRIPKTEEFQFKKGVTNLERLGKRRNDERIRKSAEARRATMQREKDRVMLGLPQMTKLKVKSSPRRFVSVRRYLRLHGYHVERGSRIAYYDENTRRSPQLEQRPFYRAFKYLPKE